MLQLIVSICLGLLLIGYACGRRAGLAEGRRLGGLEAAIGLREQAYAGGICPLCGTGAVAASVDQDSDN